MNRNNKAHNIMLAKKEFRKDLQTDKEYLQYKKEATEGGFHVVSVFNSFAIDIAPSCETLIATYLKQFKSKNK